jgi:hypothetical protein
VPRLQQIVFTTEDICRIARPHQCFRGGSSFPLVQIAAAAMGVFLASVCARIMPPGA